MTAFAFHIRPSVQAELDAAASTESLGHFHSAFQHLERAHVLAQPSTGEHVRVHWRMFRFAVRNRMTAEAFGQAWRIVGAAIFTAFGLVPEGNTGGANVSGFRRMPVPRDLQTIIKTARLQPGQPMARRNCRRPAPPLPLSSHQGCDGARGADKVTFNTVIESPRVRQ